MPRYNKPIRFDLALETTIVDQLKKVLKKEQTKTIANITLSIIATTGLLTTAIVAPNALKLVPWLFPNRDIQRRKQYQKIWRSFNDLKQQGMFKFVEEKDEYSVYKITDRGKQKIKRVLWDELSINPPKKWDKKWRLVIFDIPEKFKMARNSLSKKLSEIGFYQCQRSVWIHPFPCLEEVEFIKDIFNIKPFVKIFIVDEMTDGKVLYYFKDMLIEHSTT